MTSKKKQYGLILPKKQQLAAPKFSNVFGEDNVSDEDDNTDWVKKALKAEGEKNKMKKQTKLDIQKALNEDPTIYQYDEVYDDMERTKSESDIIKHKEKKPRYIENLLKTAERRKKEQEHRIERMVQKEREAEGEMYADKESFVTSAYRTKLEEFKKLEEEDARMSRLEAIGDVTKQQDMSGFYRHLYEQTVDYEANDEGSSKIKEKKEIEQEQKESSINDINKTEKHTSRSETDDIIDTDEKIKTVTKLKKPRQYRQRIIETYESDSATETNKEELQEDETICDLMNKNVDKEEIQEPDKKRQKQDINDTETNKCLINTNNKESDINDVKIPENCKTVVPESEKIDKNISVEKRDRSSIWIKRTVGPVFDAALQRYYARKAMRLTAI